jgi:pantoate--beta-alanine ligase
MILGVVLSFVAMMKIFKRVVDLQYWLAQERLVGRTIGFAPTMGALHAGHIALVTQSNAACDRTVVSIFVNPTQFNDPKDLEKYPRTPGTDIAQLEAGGCHALFMPEVEEVYPPGRDITVHLDFGALERVMEGAFRPGHFRGMATVVKRLLDLVQPDQLFMGQKDYQQLSIVREMLRQLGATTTLVMSPTLREADGLAMSSRNVRLTPDMRATAPVIYRTLQAAKVRLATQTATEVQTWALAELTAAGLRPEYFDIVDGITLLPVERRTDAPHVVACMAAWAGEVRLIDNVEM